MERFLGVVSLNIRDLWSLRGRNEGFGRIVEFQGVSGGFDDFCNVTATRNDRLEPKYSLKIKGLVDVAGVE